MKTSEQSVAVSYVYKVIKSHKNDNNADDENQDTRVDETLNTGNIGEVGTQIHHGQGIKKQLPCDLTMTYR